MDSEAARALAIVGHDLRQPLQAVTLYLSALERRIESPEAREILLKAERAAAEMSAMLTTLHEFARVHSPDFSPQLETVALSEVLAAVAAAFPAAQVEASAGGTKAGQARADRMLLDIVLRQLVANALMFAGDARVVAHDGEIAVIDTGPGLAPDDQLRLFEPFVQLDKAKGGMGLGLAIAKRAAELMGASLTLTSAPGEGARMTIALLRA